jgi:acetylornithine deacetylase/succinyl-diaminopimelate desuccinylase-like protein
VSTPPAAASDIHTRPGELLRNLIRFDTSNPPGNERGCIAYIDGLIQAVGIDTKLVGRDPERPNLFARIEGRGAAAPLLLYGHVDVVPTAGQKWSHPPFEAVEQDGYIWGRGAVDMKGGVAMMLAAFLRAVSEGLEPAGDVIFCAMCDEEALGGYGAKWLVSKHPEQFHGVRYAISEFGGFASYFGGKRFYPIQVAEKQVCTVRATLHGPAGHGSMPLRGGTMAALGRVLERLDRKRLPVHVTPIVRQMVETVAKQSSGATGFLMRQLANPVFTDRILDRLGDRGRMLDALLHNTASPTVIETDPKFNVIPGQIELILDARLLPGLAPEDMVNELGDLLGEGVELEVIHHEPSRSQPDMALYEMLAEILEQADPDSKAMPLLMPGITDGRFLSQLGVQTYGFLPMNVPPEFNFWEVIHAADERVPVAAVAFGTNAIYKALERYGANS